MDKCSGFTIKDEDRRGHAPDPLEDGQGGLLGHEVVPGHEAFVMRDYTTSFISKYNILDRVVEYYKNKKQNQGNAQKAAAMAAVDAVIAGAQTNHPEKWVIFPGAYFRLSM